MEKTISKKGQGELNKGKGSKYGEGRKFKVGGKHTMRYTNIL